MIRDRWLPLALVGLAMLLLLPMTAGHGGDHGHPEDDEETVLDECRSAAECRTVTGLIGYDWFGTGAWGMVLGTAFWVLVLFGVVKLVQRRDG